MYTLAVSVIGLFLLALLATLIVSSIYHIYHSKDGLMTILLIIIIILVGVIIFSIPCTGFQMIQVGNLSVTPDRCALYV